MSTCGHSFSESAGPVHCLIGLAVLVDFFFNSLVVGVPCSLIFYCFRCLLISDWLLSSFWLCEEAKGLYLHLHLDWNAITAYLYRDNKSSFLLEFKLKVAPKSLMFSGPTSYYVACYNLSLSSTKVLDRGGKSVTLCLISGLIPSSSTPPSKLPYKANTLHFLSGKLGNFLMSYFHFQASVPFGKKKCTFRS